MATTDPYDRLRTARPITALKSANALIQENRRLYLYSLLILGFSGVFNTLTSDAPVEDMLIFRGIGLLVLPLGWLVFYGAVLHTQRPTHTPFRDTLSDLWTRYPAYVGAHVLFRALFWSVALIVLLGILPITLFINGYTSPIEPPGTPGNLPIDGMANAIIIPVILAILVGGLISYFLQFYDLEVLLNDAGPREALANSRELVQQNHRAVFGYFLARSLLPVFLSLPLVAAPLLGGLGEMPSAAVLVLIAVTVPTVVLGWLLTTLLGTYHVTFYKELKNSTR